MTGLKFTKGAPSCAFESQTRSFSGVPATSLAALIKSTVAVPVGRFSALRAMEQGKRVAVVGRPESYSERDFMDGEVERLLRGLVEGGAAALETPDAIPEWVAKTG